MFFFLFLGYISRLKSSLFQFFWNAWVYCFFVVAFGGVIFLVFFITTGIMSTSNVDVFGVRFIGKNYST